MECEEELRWRNEIGCSYMGRQYPPASHSEESFFTFLDDKNFDTFRSFILFYFWSPIFFQCLPKPLESQVAKQQSSCLGSW